MTIEKTLPIRGYLLVDPDESELKKKTKNLGIILADNVTSYDLPQTGKVLKVGGDLITESGAIIPSPVSEGDKIIFKKWGGNEIKIDEKSYYFVRFDDILGLC